MAGQTGLALEISYSGSRQHCVKRESGFPVKVSKYICIYAATLTA